MCSLRNVSAGYEGDLFRLLCCSGLHPECLPCCAQEFGLDVTRSAALSILPWGVNVVCTNLAGWLGDKAINERGLDRTLVRKVMQGIASLGPAACLLALASDQGAPLPLRFPYRPHHPKSSCTVAAVFPMLRFFTSTSTEL